MEKAKTVSTDPNIGKYQLKMTFAPMTFGELLFFWKAGIPFDYETFNRTAQKLEFYGFKLRNTTYISAVSMAFSVPAKDTPLYRSSWQWQC